MDAAIGRLQGDWLDPDQIAASRAVMGLDTQLIRDGSYFVIACDGRLAACGGWSHRATLYGGDHSAPLRDDAPLVPGRDPARVRAMYTHPDFVRRGLGRTILSACEDAARAAGFTRAELMATLAGEPLYSACGYVAIDRTAASAGNGVAVPLIRMGKALNR